MCNFWHLCTLTLSPEHSPERQSTQISKITSGGLTRSGTGCFISIPIRQQWTLRCWYLQCRACVYACVFCVFFVLWVIFFVDFPSVLWYCWLGLLTCKNCLPYNLYCVGGDVKHCTIQSQCPSICLSVCQPVHKVRVIWTKFGVWIEFDECYAMVCHMTQSKVKVKVMEVWNMWKWSISKIISPPPICM